MQPQYILGKKSFVKILLHRDLVSYFPPGTQSTSYKLARFKPIPKPFVITLTRHL